MADLARTNDEHYPPPVPQLTLKRKLAILSDAAKYDASCASSGTAKRNSVGGKGVGSTEGNGICHAYAPDGRCISLLKILLTNFCTYDCAYCVNRVSSNVARARFSVAVTPMTGVAAAGPGGRCATLRQEAAFGAGGRACNEAS